MDDKNLEKTELNEEELSQVDGGGKMEAEGSGVRMVAGNAATVDSKWIVVT